MAQRGRKSTAGLSVLRVVPGQERPEPPDELTKEEASEWRSIAERLPADWFTRETHGQLVNYCRHIVKARRVAEQVSAFRQEWLETDEGLHRYDKLLHMAERESRAIASLGTKMRITQQSRYAHKTAHAKASDASTAPKHPWQQRRDAAAS